MTSSMGTNKGKSKVRVRVGVRVRVRGRGRGRGRVRVRVRVRAREKGKSKSKSKRNGVRESESTWPFPQVCNVLLGIQCGLRTASTFSITGHDSQALLS